MPKIFKNYDGVQSREILNLMEKANKLTDGDGYKLYDDNAESLERILDKILITAKQEKEWQSYFRALYEMFYLLSRGDKCIKMLKYAEVFYRDSALYMDIAVADYPDIDTGYYSILCYSQIFSVYKKFPQITDEKMEAFMKQYRQTVEKYGEDKNYYQDKLTLSLLYKDMTTAKMEKEKLEQSDIRSCYLCAMKPVLGYYLLCEDYESLEHMIFEIRTRQIPAKHRWCYAHCYLAEDRELIREVLGYCLMFGRSRYFHKLLDENRSLFEIKPDDAETLEFYLYACLRDWTNLIAAVKEMEKDVENWQKGQQSALGYMHDCLCWYCYFTMLDREGRKEAATEPDRFETHEVVTKLAEKVNTEYGKLENEECSCLDIAAYFEKEADKIGVQMEASRKKFDYSALKRSYKECINMECKQN